MEQASRIKSIGGAITLVITLITLAVGASVVTGMLLVDYMNGNIVHDSVPLHFLYIMLMLMGTYIILMSGYKFITKGLSNLVSILKHDGDVMTSNMDVYYLYEGDSIKSMALAKDQVTAELIFTKVIDTINTLKGTELSLEDFEIVSLHPGKYAGLLYNGIVTPKEYERLQDESDEEYGEDDHGW